MKFDLVDVSSFILWMKHPSKGFGYVVQDLATPGSSELLSDFFNSIFCVFELKFILYCHLLRWVFHLKTTDYSVAYRYVLFFKLLTAA